MILHVCPELWLETAGPLLDGAAPPVGLQGRILREVEYPLIVATLEVTRGNQVKAAEILGINRNTLRKRIRELGIWSGR